MCIPVEARLGIGICDVEDLSRGRHVTSHSLVHGKPERMRADPEVKLLKEFLNGTQKRIQDFLSVVPEPKIRKRTRGTLGTMGVRAQNFQNTRGRAPEAPHDFLSKAKSCEAAF